MKISNNLTNTPLSQPVAPAYCHKLKSGIGRLKIALQDQYRGAFPDHADSIRQAMAEAEVSAWATPFPSLFFPALARIRLSELAPEAQSSPSPYSKS